MTISRVNASGWASGDKLTSGQANGLDNNTTFALDKRSGQTDTLQSIVSCTGAGRLVRSYAAGADANTTYTLSSGIGIINAVTGLTAARTYTLSNTGAVAGDSIVVLAGSQDVTVKDASTATLIVLGATNTGNNQSRWAEFVYTGSAWILLRSSFAPQQQRTTFTSNGTYTVPADCYKLLVIGCGGGGGGGGGNGGGTNSANRAAGGGGGGGALVGATWVDTTPGATFAVTIGAAGSAGAGGNAAGAVAASQGGDGGATTFGSTLTFNGAQGGNGAPAAAAIATFVYVLGGGHIANGTRPDPTTATVALSPGITTAGQGGYGGTDVSTASTPATAGAYAHVQSTTGGSGTTAPGTGGAPGTISGAYHGGGGGGGGGASAFGSGGAGGAGGNGNSAGAATVGTAGTAGGTGAGGGGAGSSGTGSSGSVNGVNGGAGGTGALVVIPIR